MKRLLVVYYSQSGQLRRALDALLSGLEPGSFDVRFAPIRPRKPYPFPWTLMTFLGVFPEAVLGEVPEIEPIDAGGEGPFDLVLLGSTVWYLAPSLPVQAFLRSPSAAVLKGVSVATLVSCRNMWHAAALRLGAQIREAGGEHVDGAVITDRAPAWATFITTPRWMLTGRRGPFWFFPPAGVSDGDIASLARLGAALSAPSEPAGGGGGRSRWAGLDPVRLDTKFLITEVVGERLFRLWARFILASGPARSWRRSLALGIFAVGLILSVLILLPISVLLRPAVALLLRKWYDARLRSLKAPSENPSG